MKNRHIQSINSKVINSFTNYFYIYIICIITIFLFPFIAIIIGDNTALNLGTLYTFGIDNLKDFFTVWIALFGAIGISFNIYQNWKRLSQQEEQLGKQDSQIEQQAKQQRDNRFFKSIELMGDDQESVRIGGAFSLYLLVKEFPDVFKDQVFKILCCHIQTITKSEIYKKNNSNVSNEIQTILKFLFINPKDVDTTDKSTNDLVFVFEDMVGELHEAVLARAHLRMAFLSRADLSGADLTFSNLSGAKLDKANLSEAILFRTILSGANLSGAKLDYANLYRAELDKANLSEAILYRTNLSEANFSGAKLNKANLSGADLTGAKLNEANLSEANLSGAKLEKAILFNTYLSGANLHSTNLLGANLSGADLSGAKINNTNLSEAILDKTIFTTGALNKAILDNTDISKIIWV